MENKRLAKLKAITKPIPKVIKSKDTTLKSTEDLVNKAKSNPKDIILVNLPKNLSERYKQGDFFTYSILKNFKFVISEKSSVVHTTQCLLKPEDELSSLDLYTTDLIYDGLKFMWGYRKLHDKNNLSQEGIKDIDIYKISITPEVSYFNEDLTTAYRIAFDIKFKTKTHAHRWLRNMLESYPKLRVVKEVKY